MGDDKKVIPIRKKLGKGGRSILGGQDAPFGNRDNDQLELPDWWKCLDVDKHGQPTPQASNAVVALQRSGQWRGLRFNELRHEPVLETFPELEGFDPPKTGPVDDYTVSYITHWLAVMYKIRVGTNAAHSAIEIASKAKGRAFHPVREYLRGLDWDRVPRIGKWLHTYCGANDDEYTSQVGRMWFIGACARACQENSVVKNIIILEGKQDVGKSTMLRKLCKDEAWFADTPIDLGSSSADKYQVLRGKWIYELSELEGMRGKEATRVKSFISSKTDTFRKSYGRGSQDVPRQCVLAGTTNEDHYLVDPTGNVRFWPVLILWVDFDGIDRDRDQLWAEAMASYMDGAAWHITDPRIKDLAKHEQEAREEEDVWAPAIGKWLGDLGELRRAKTGFTTTEVLSEAISMPIKDQGDPHKSRVGRVLKKLGCSNKPGKARPRKYVMSGGEQEK